MPMQYPVLDNRPIDQWKVVELKEELRRRKITTKGLKEDLLKRLDEAIRSETNSISEELGNGFNLDSNCLAKCSDGEVKPIDSEMVEAATDVIANKIDKVIDDASEADNDESNIEDAQGIKVQNGESMGNTNSGTVIEETVILAALSDNRVTDSQSVLQLSSVQESKNEETLMGNEGSNPPLEDVELSVSDCNNQVSEVSPVLGFQVKCESISAHSILINEKNKLKDNLNADNVHLEIEVVEPETAQPLSSDGAPLGGDLQSLDDQERGGNESSLQEIDDDIVTTNVELGKKNDSVDGGSSEKLNLDRSSGDDSLEEYVLESKQIDSNHVYDEAVDRSEVTESHVVKEGSSVDATVVRSFSNEKDVLAENNNVVVSVEKRKFEAVCTDQEAVGISEPSKRQRRWNLESHKIPELQASNLSPSTPRDVFHSIPKRVFARSESTLSDDNMPKERVVPPSQRSATTSLRIDRFLRPFTLKAAQELLAKSGTVCSFWMDHIKTHCYVTYSSVDEATKTRNALYNLQWPLNGGHLLIAEFVDPQEVKIRAEASTQSSTPPVSSKLTPPTPLPPVPDPPRQNLLRQKLPPPPPLPLPPPPPVSDPLLVRERLPLPPPPPLKKPEPTVVTLDDLFKKTKATPRIYYLPLSEEQVATKLASRGRSNSED